MSKESDKMSAIRVIKIRGYKIESNFISLSNSEKQSRSNQFWEIMIGSSNEKNREV
jgi:hypothetical protein